MEYKSELETYKPEDEAKLSPVKTISPKVSVISKKVKSKIK